MSIKKIIKDKSRVLGDLEYEIMRVLWEKNGATVREVVDYLKRERKVAYTTIMTVMTRLVDKGLLCRLMVKDGSYLYKPKESREEFYGKVSGLFLRQLLEQTGAAAMIPQFIDVLEKADPDLLNILKKRIKK